jgi:hypothetical protein
MSRYDTYKAGDDRKLEEQELGFKGFNDRLRPDQIQSGLLQKSENARLDLNGQWQSRKGVQNRLSPFAVSGTALRLPTEDEITAGEIMLLSHTVSAATHSGGVVTLTTYNEATSAVDDHHLSVGDTIQVNDIVSDDSNPDLVNGTFTIASVPTGSTLTYAVSGSSTLTISNGANMIATGGTDVTADSYSRSSTTLTINETAHGLSNGTAITISGLSVSSGTNPNGDRFISNVSTNSFDVVVSGLAATPIGTLVYNHGKSRFSFTPQELTTGTPPKFLPCGGAVILNDSAVSEVTCACKFSDPNETTDEEFILLASNAKVVAFNTSTLESFDMPLKSGETIPEDSTILQVFNKVIIFRGGQISLENDKFFSPFTISKATRGDVDSSGDAATVARITTFANHGLETGDSVDISGLTGTTSPLGQFAITKISDKVFTYSIGSGSGSETYTLSDAKVSPTFLLVPNGSFTQRLELDITDLDYADGIATATVSSTSSLKNGTDLKVVTVESSGFTVGDIVTVSEVLTSTTFTFITDKANDTNKSMHVTLPISEGLGFTHSPAPNFGAYHNKRLVVPYNFEITGSSGSATITDRNIKDEVLISDILDSDTFDQIFSQFRFNAGGADFIVGFQSFANDQLIIFNRNSIHTVNNTVNLVSSTVKQVTDEVGCIARGSIEQIGSEILFLSDNGVYGISFVDEYNLRGTALPLSESINKTIQRINKAHADKAVSAYFDNRYYLAVPLLNEDGSGSETITENNAVIIYNFLNKHWESIDTYGNGTTTFDILDLIVAGKGTNRAVYAINKQGGIHQLDVNESGQDAIISTLGQETATAVEVDAKARTRQFTIGSIDRKKWNDFEIHAESGVTYPTDFSIVANTENIDEENISLNSLKSLNGGSNLAAEEDVAIRGRIGNKRAYGLDIEITRVTGRPKLRAVKVSGVETFRSTNKAI